MRDSDFLKKKVQTSISTITFNSEIDKPYISDETKEQLRKAKILLIPQDDYSIGDGRKVFPSGTINLYKFISEHLSDKNEINICIEDKDYQELGLHADVYTIAIFVTLNIYLPLVISLIAAYLYDLIKGKSRDAVVKSKIVVINEKDKQTIEYSYVGPVDEYEESLNSAIKAFSKNSKGEK